MLCCCGDTTKCGMAIAVRNRLRGGASVDHEKREEHEKLALLLYNCLAHRAISI